MVDYLCKICAIVINRKSQTNHIKSKSHLCINQNYVINKHVIRDVFWEDVEETICQYINENRSRFCFFKTVVKCNVHDEEISVYVSGDKRSVKLYKFPNGGHVYYEFSVSKQIRDYIYHRAMLKEIDLVSSSIINNLT